MTDVVYAVVMCGLMNPLSWVGFVIAVAIVFDAFVRVDAGICKKNWKGIIKGVLEGGVAFAIYFLLDWIGYMI